MRRVTFFAALLALAAQTVAAAETMRMAVTTSFDSSGLSEVLLPAIAEDLGIEVQLLVVGTGQALKLGEAGDVDAVLVHSKSAEEAFVSAGFGRHRREIMYNDFVLIGPSEDPAGISDAETVSAALQKIAASGHAFASRGDDSGTHKMELALWSSAGIDLETLGDGYKATGSGMGATLNTAAGLDAYVMSDRASWLKFGNKGNLELLFAGDPALFNQYAYLPVNPERHPHVRHDLAMRLEAWLAGPEGKSLVDGYTLEGEPLFTHNATMN